MRFLVALLSTALLAPLCATALRRFEALDRPNLRSSHSRPIPRGGGVAVVLPVVVLMALAGDVPWRVRLAVAGATGVLAMVGLADDLTGGLGVAFRLVVVVVVGVVATALIAEPHGVVGPLAVGVGAVWVAGYLNAFNFMDGINGIAGLHGALAGVLLGGIGSVDDHRFLAVAGWALAGGCVGFLPYNALRARVFLGDAGSYGIGAVIALLVVVAVKSGVPPEAAAGSLVPYLADTSWTLAQRVRRGERWREAHRRHVYQRLTDGGRPHPHVALFVAATSATTGVLGLVAFAGGAWRIVADVAVAVLASAYLASPRVLDPGALPA